MKRLITALLLIVMLAQTLPFEALATVGKTLSQEELDRAWALTGLGRQDDAWHSGMKANASMSGIQLARWLEERLDNQLHNLDDILARSRYRLDELQEKYPAVYKVFTGSDFYARAQALTVQVEALRMDLSWQRERVRTDINMISQMRSRLQDDEGSLFDSERVRASARVEAAANELVEIRDYVNANAATWDAQLLDWTGRVQSEGESGAAEGITASLKRFMEALWRKYNLQEGADEAFRQELRNLLTELFARHAPQGTSAEAFADDAMALMQEILSEIDPDRETGREIIARLQALMGRLYGKYGEAGADDETLRADIEAFMRELWVAYGPGSSISQALNASLQALLIKHGFDEDAVEAFGKELKAIVEEMWNKYGPDGESKAALLEQIKSLWGDYGAAIGKSGIGQWISALFTADSQPVANSASVRAVAASNTVASRLSTAAGLVANDADATVTVISKNEVCLAFVIGENQSRKGVSGVRVKLRDATRKNAPLTPYTSNEDGLVILPSNLFVADKYDEVHLYVEVDPRAQGYRNYIIEDLELKLGGTFVDVLTPMDEARANGGVTSNAAQKPYIIAGSFNGKDIMHSEYEMIYSPANNRDFTIKAVVEVPEGLDLPDLMMSWYENAGGFKKLQKHWAEATSKQTTPEGYVEYTFRGRWKQKFSPNASDEQRPTFSFGKEKDTLSYPTQLVALRSATDTPLNEGTGAEGGVYASVLGKGFGMGFNIPVVDVGVGLNIPFLKYLPHLSINPAGFVVGWIGCPILGEELEDSSLNWESKDMKQFRQASEFVERESWFANYKAQYALASDFYTEKKWKFMGQSSIEVGIFAVGTGRWELDNDDPDVKTKNIQLAVGFGATACYEYSWTISYPVGPVPVYVCFSLGVCAGVSIQFTADICWVNGGFQNFKLYPVDEITYSISFYFAAQLGVGIKGFLEAYVRFVASLDVMIRMVLFGLDKCSTEVTAGFELSTGVTVFFVAFRKTWISKEMTVFSTVPADNSLLSHYMNADKNAEKIVEAAHLDPQSYPNLESETHVTLTLTDANTAFKTVSVNDKDYAFYIAPNGSHRRVQWRRTDNATSIKGSTQPAIDAWQTSLNGCDDYAFDVIEADGLVYVAVACASKFDANGLPLPNEGIENGKRCNQVFYLLMLKPDSSGNLTHVLDKGYYTRTDREEDHFFVTGEPVGRYKTSYGSYSADTVYYYDSIATPEITWAKATKKSGKVLGVELFGTFGRIGYKEDEPAHGVTSFEMITDKSVKCFNDRYVVSGMGDNYARTEVRGAMRCSDTEPKLYHRAGNNELNSPSFVALSKPVDGKGDSAIEVFDFEMNAVNDMFGRKAVVVAQGDIQHFELAQTAVDGDGSNYRRVIFYTQKEVNDEGLEQSRLYGLYLEPVVRRDKGITFTVTRYAYDLVIPGGQFKLTYMGETPYIYWLSALPDPDQKDKNKWRVWTVAYDMSTNAMTDASVFAEFSLPEYQIRLWRSYGTKLITIKDTVLNDLMLMGNGLSYFTIVPRELSEREKVDLASPIRLCSFTETLKPVVDLKAAITQAPAVSAGSFEDISLALMNEGNMGVATFDIAMYEVTNGKEGNSPVETVHVNCVDPDKSKITLQNGSVELTGKKVARRAEDFDYTARQRDWVLSEEKKEYSVAVYGNENVLESVTTVDSTTQYVKSEVLMPGSIGVYNTAFLIPASWRGKKTLRFKIEKLSVRSNMKRLSANAAEGDESDLLTWVLDRETGQLVLQRPAQANGIAANAIATGLFANATDASALDMELSIHDLDVSHRVYRGWDGEKWLDIVLHNYAAFGDSPKLACAVYLDGASEPYYVNLPCYEQAIASRTTQTISMPLSALVSDPSAHSRARVEVSVVGREDGVHVNNEFTVYLGGSSALSFVRQPEDTTVQEGEDVSFTVEVTGGTTPYSYQWQIYNPKTGEWEDLKGFTEPTMSREKIEKKWDGCRFRCVVTDAAGTQIVSEAFTLTVRDRVDTGDHSNLPLYLSVALVALALLLALRRWRRTA